MSHAKAAGAPAKTEDHGEATHKRSYRPLIFLAVVIIVGVTVYNLLPDKKTSPKKNNTEEKSQTTSSTPEQVQESGYTTYPAIEPQIFEINGEFSEKKVMPDGYYISFVCDQPYEIKKANGALVQSEANKCANIGLKKAEESTENSILEFHTLNSSTTTMTIIFTPMKIKN